MGVVGYGLEDGFSQARTNSMRVQQTHQGRWVKISGLPKFGTTNSHNMYVAAAVWKVSKKRTQATRRLGRSVSDRPALRRDRARTGYTRGPYTRRCSSCTTE
jgi:hypothetical protein